VIDAVIISARIALCYQTRSQNCDELLPSSLKMCFESHIATQLVIYGRFALNCVFLSYFMCVFLYFKASVSAVNLGIF